MTEQKLNSCPFCGCDTLILMQVESLAGTPLYELKHKRPLSFDEVPCFLERDAWKKELIYKLWNTRAGESK